MRRTIWESSNAAVAAAPPLKDTDDKMKDLAFDDECTPVRKRSRKKPDEEGAQKATGLQVVTVTLPAYKTAAAGGTDAAVAGGRGCGPVAGGPATF